MDPKTECKKLNRRIQVRDEQVSYQSSNCRRTRGILAKISTMSDLNRPAKVGKMQAEVSFLQRDGKAFHKSVLPRMHYPLVVRCRKVHTGDLTQFGTGAPLIRQWCGLCRVDWCLTVLSMVSLRQACLLNL